MAGGVASAGPGNDDLAVCVARGDQWPYRMGGDRLDDGRGVYSSAVNANTRVDPRYNRIRLVQSIGESWYKGVTVALNKRWSNGIQYSVNYTLGEGIDTAPLGGNVLAIQGDSPRSDPNDLERDKARNQLDIRHTVNASIVALSSVSRFSPVVNTLLSDHQIAVMAVINSGQPDAIDSTRDLNLDGFNNDRPLFVERNALTAPVRTNFDIRYSRFFRIWGDRRLELQVESKNIFNTEQWSGATSVVTTDAQGNPALALPAPGAVTDDAVFNPSGGYEQRQAQLGFRVTF